MKGIAAIFQFQLAFCHMWPHIARSRRSHLQCKRGKLAFYHTWPYIATLVYSASASASLHGEAGKRGH